MPKPRLMILSDIDETVMFNAKRINKGLVAHFKGLAAKQDAEINFFTSMSYIGEKMAELAEGITRAKLLHEIGLTDRPLYTSGVLSFGGNPGEFFSKLFHYSSQDEGFSIKGCLKGSPEETEEGMCLELSFLFLNLDFAIGASLIYEKISSDKSSPEIEKAITELKETISTTINNFNTSFKKFFKRFDPSKSHDHKGKTKLSDFLPEDLLEKLITLQALSAKIQEILGQPPKPSIDPIKSIADILVQETKELSPHYETLMEHIGEISAAYTDTTKEDESPSKSIDKLTMYLQFVKDHNPTAEDTFVLYDDNPHIIEGIKAAHAALGYPCQLVCIQIQKEHEHQPPAFYDQLLKAEQAKERINSITRLKTDIQSALGEIRNAHRADALVEHTKAFLALGDDKLDLVKLTHLRDALTHMAHYDLHKSVGLFAGKSQIEREKDLKLAQHHLSQASTAIKKIEFPVVFYKKTPGKEEIEEIKSFLAAEQGKPPTL